MLGKFFPLIGAPLLAASLLRADDLSDLKTLVLTLQQRVKALELQVQQAKQANPPPEPATPAPAPDIYTGTIPPGIPGNPRAIT